MSEFLERLMKRLRLLPVLVAVASLTFMVRVGDTFMEIKHMSGAAYAQDKPVDAKTAAKTDSKVPDLPADPAKVGVKDANGAIPPKEPLDEAGEKALPEDISKEKPPSTADAIKLPSTSATNEKKDWADSETDFDNSAVRKEVYDDLMARRQLIETKEKELEQREALLKAGTEEVNKKVEELSSIKNEIQSLLKKQSADDAANTDRLVKIYEGMKPKDAARIFDQLDMDVLLSVVTKMSERKVSPIIAVMNPEKARSLTLFLSEQNKLPSSSNTPTGFGDPMKPPALPESAVR